MARLQRILLVEDEPDIQEIARLALEAIGGFTVGICSSGTEALEQMTTFQPDLILLDVMMPGLNGPDTLRALREQPATAHIPTIFMTARVQPRELVHYRDLGVLDVIAKPFDPMTLSAAITEIWSRHHEP